MFLFLFANYLHTNSILKYFLNDTCGMIQNETQLITTIECLSTWQVTV